MLWSIYSSTLYCISVKLWYYQDIKIPKLCYEYENFNIKKLFIWLIAKNKKLSHGTTNL